MMCSYVCYEEPIVMEPEKNFGADCYIANTRSNGRSQQFLIITITAPVVGQHHESIQLTSRPSRLSCLNFILLRFRRVFITYCAQWCAQRRGIILSVNLFMVRISFADSPLSTCVISLVLCN